MAQYVPTWTMEPSKLIFQAPEVLETWEIAEKSGPQQR
jgi:hypothetical protein